jgi:hypothetical protein
MQELPVGDTVIGPATSISETGGPTALPVTGIAATSVLARVAGNVTGLPVAVFQPGGGSFTLFPGTWASGDVGQWSGTGWVPKMDDVLELSSSFPYNAATTGFATVTGLGFSLPRAGTYFYRAALATSISTSITVGYGLVSSVAITRAQILVEIPTTTTARTVGVQSNNTPSITASRTVLTSLPVFISGSITVPSAATLNLQISKSTNGSTHTVLSGSSARVFEA